MLHILGCIFEYSESLVNRFLCTLHKMVIFAGIVHARSVLSVQISTIKNCIMKRVFVFQDFKSQKFWSIEVVGTCLLYTSRRPIPGLFGQLIAIILLHSFNADSPA